MGKRVADAHSDSHAKRQKLEDELALAPTDISSTGQLNRLLAFQQDSLPELRNGIKTFKSFLESILYAPDKSATKKQQDILLSYLHSQSPKHESDAESPMLPSLVQAWSLAANANNDGFVSAVSSVFALLLRTISTLIDFREIGVQLCRMFLQQSQLKLISRSLSAQKQKEHVISPCLRLLTEIVSFDGGAVAQRLFDAKYYTFDGNNLARNLSLWGNASDDENGVRRRPTVRSNALRYLLANFTYQSSSNKTEILKYGNVIRAFFEHLKHDPHDLIKDTLATLKARIVLDKTIPHRQKAYLFAARNLCSVANIYRRDQTQKNHSDDEILPAKLAHAFLLFVCSEPTAGVLKPFAGWYPVGVDTEKQIQDVEERAIATNLGLEAIEWYNRYRTEVPIRNHTLAEFVQFLRPYADVLEGELVLQIFESAPELVADFFFKKSTFAFDPKLTSTWVGFASFLFSACRLPVPEYFGRRAGYAIVPPPSTIVLENILPQPLSQKTLTRSLNQPIELITFFTARVLIVAFQKMKVVLKEFRTAAKTESFLWTEGIARLLEEFTQRCPKMKDVISAFRKTPVRNSTQREALLRLLVLYYEVTPQVAFEEKFDTSTSLGSALGQFQKLPEFETMSDSLEDGKDDDRDLRLLELNHHLQIAQWTPDMNWWHKPESLTYSPFMTLLKLVVELKQENTPREMRLLLESIVEDHGMLQHQTETPAIHAVIASLTSHESWSPGTAVFEFLDDAFARAVRKPIKYEDDLDSFVYDLLEPGPTSLLLLTLVEQWKFAAEKAKSSYNVARWLSRCVYAFMEIGEDERVLENLLASMIEQAKTEEDRRALSNPDRDLLSATLLKLKTGSSSQYSLHVNGAGVNEIQSRLTIDANAFAPPEEDSRHNGLHRWTTKDIPSAVADGDVSALILCLSSEHPEVRHRALASIWQVMKNINAIANSYPELGQVYLLLGVLANTVTSTVHNKEGEDSEDSKPTPYICTIYACLSLEVLRDPLHPLYEKTSKFLTKSPKWDIERLPSSWTHQILYTPPTPSSQAPPSSSSLQATGNGIPSNPHQFLLHYLYLSLRTPADLEVLRRRKTFEPILALASHPFLAIDLYAMILKIVWRATCIEGGSTMLITRKGIVAWLCTQVLARDARRVPLNADEKDDKLDAAIVSATGLRLLLKRLWETCDRDHVDAWSEGMMESTVQTWTTGL